MPFASEGGWRAGEPDAVIVMTLAVGDTAIEGVPILEVYGARERWTLASAPALRLRGPARPAATRVTAVAATPEPALDFLGAAGQRGLRDADRLSRARHVSALHDCVEGLEVLSLAPRAARV